MPDANNGIMILMGVLTHTSLILIHMIKGALSLLMTCRELVAKYTKNPDKFLFILIVPEYIILSLFLG